VGCDIRYLLKAKDSNYEIEIDKLSLFHNHTGRRFTQRYCYWFLVYRRPWPNEEGIYEPPQRTLQSMVPSEILELLDTYADTEDLLTKKIVAAIKNKDWPENEIV